MSTQSILGSPSSICFTVAGERLLRTSAVAARIGVCPRMVRYLITDGRLGAIRKGKLLFCTESEVDRFLRFRKVRSQS